MSQADYRCDAAEMITAQLGDADAAGERRPQARSRQRAPGELPTAKDESASSPHRPSRSRLEPNRRPTSVVLSMQAARPVAPKRTSAFPGSTCSTPATPVGNPHHWRFRIREIRGGFFQARMSLRGLWSASGRLGRGVVLQEEVGACSRHKRARERKAGGILREGKRGASDTVLLLGSHRTTCCACRSNERGCAGS